MSRLVQGVTWLESCLQSYETEFLLSMSEEKMSDWHWVKRRRLNCPMQMKRHCGHKLLRRQTFEKTLSRVRHFQKPLEVYSFLDRPRDYSFQTSLLPIHEGHRFCGTIKRLAICLAKDSKAIYRSLSLFDTSFIRLDVFTPLNCKLASSFALSMCLVQAAF